MVTVEELPGEEEAPAAFPPAEAEAAGRAAVKAFEQQKAAAEAAAAAASKEAPPSDLQAPAVDSQVSRSNAEARKTSASAAEGFFGRVLRCLTCQKRKAKTPNGYTLKYRDMVILGRKLKDKDDYKKMAWWTDAETKKTGERVFVIAPRGPNGMVEWYVDMDQLLAFVVFNLHDHVVTKNKRYSIIWDQLSDHRVFPFQALSFKKCLHERYAENLGAVHVVHPSWSTRFLRLFLWPIASEEFWDYFLMHERIEFMDRDFDLRKLELPPDLYEFDKFLDKQAAEIAEQAAKMHTKGRFASAFGMNMDDPSGSGEPNHYEKKLKELEEMMKERGIDPKNFDPQRKPTSKKDD
eukprot:gnl/TRDRNA2_/TRDRNA2_199370_c0_seq1.p1 gnl/TRDRNA2_/TRDRNA2_199370_c0~~gnl/TRDRNA2_/TRDRNA2_199370_c0_seq1.p1  ORF type:complete len:350 (+),score=94.15 gnl/TRDRNA2_/TRDRNA2_199370_c0_seq1:42-1091(+)